MSTNVMVARRSLRANLFATAVGQGLTWMITAAMFAILPRYFGPHSLGVLSIGAAFSSFAWTAGSLGLATVITRDIARDRESANDIIATALAVNGAFGVVVGIAATIIGAVVGYPREIVIAIALSCAAVPATLVYSSAIAVFQGLEVMHYAARADILFKTLGLGCVLIVVLGRMTPVHYLIIVLLMTTAFALYQAMVLQSLTGFSLRQASHFKARYLVVTSIPFLLSVVLTGVYTGLDVLMLSILASETAVGIYAAPLRLFGTMLVVPTIIMTVMFPRMSATFGHGEGQLGDVVQGTLKITLLATVAVAIGCMALGPGLVRLILGAEFEQSGTVMIIFALTLIPTSIGVVATRAAFASQRQKVVVQLGAVAIGLKAVFGVLLIPWFDSWIGNAAVGAVVGLTIVESIVVLATLWRLREMVASADLFRFSVSTGAAGLLGMAVLPVSQVAGPLGAGMVAGLVYLVACLALRVFAIDDLRDSVGWAMGRGSVPAFLMPSR